MNSEETLEKIENLLSNTHYLKETEKNKVREILSNNHEEISRVYSEIERNSSYAFEKEIELNIQAAELATCPLLATVALWWNGLMKQDAKAYFGVFIGVLMSVGLAGITYVCKKNKIHNALENENNNIFYNLLESNKRDNNEVIAGTKENLESKL